MNTSGRRPWGLLAILACTVGACDDQRLVSPTPTPTLLPIRPAGGLQVQDIGNTRSGADIEVRFDASQDDALVSAYRVVMVGGEQTLSGSASALGHTYFELVPPGPGRRTVRLTTQSTDARGLPIVEGEWYRAFVVTVPKDTASLALSASELSRTLIPIDTDSPRPGCGGYPDWSTSGYVLPYPAGTEYRVMQGNCSPWTAGHHVGKNGGAPRYAYDISMPIGTPVSAIRGGTVVFIKEDRPNYEPLPGNSLWIDHGDGTLGFYAHLDQGGVLVSMGQEVEAGELVARSGASGGLIGGWEHLHFAVHECTNVVQCPSLPLTFSNTSSNPRGLEFGVIYPAHE